MTEVIEINKPALKKIELLWEESEFPKPKNLLMYHSGKTYLVARDDKSVHTFISEKGKIYMIVASKCKEIEHGRMKIYTILNKRSLQIISCAPISKLDSFVTNKLLPVYFA